MNSLDFFVIDAPGYFVIDVIGAYDFEDAKALIRLILREAESRRSRCVLVDLMRMGDDIPQWERFLLGKETGDVIGGKVQIAVAAPAEKINYFWEDTAVNRGAHAGVFPGREAALEWLLHGKRAARGGKGKTQ
jgi:hypothetical protein